MNRQSVNTFTDGLNKDIDKSLMSNKAYLDAQNFRMITTKGNSTGSLETIKGNKLISSSLVVNGQFIIGSCEIRDKIVLFTTSNTSSTPNGGRSMIYTITVDLKDEEQDSITVLYDDSLNTDASNLNFSTYYPIKAVGKYETPNVQKIYWTDGYNNLRYVNIADYLTVDGVNDTDYMTVDKFEFLPKFIPTKPILKNIVGGKVNTGMIAYAYQLYIINGAETAFSVTSDPIHVVSDNDFLSNTLNYKGDVESINSGKGFIMEINNTGNIGYNRLRLVRIHYSTLNSVPQIIICNEISISPLGSTVKVTDTGENLGDITIDEFNISSTELFRCQDLDTKDNRLFVANVSKSEFTVDTWDARAVRFKSGSTATVYDNNTPLEITVPTSDTSAEWDAHGWSSYIISHDGINQFNDPTKDGVALYQWMYQANGSTLGAEGKNIKIGFEVEDVTIDSSNDDTTFYTRAPSSGIDLSYQSYASPWKGGKLSWQRDEIYRLFIVFGNERGQLSDPKWICDLRMPSLHDIGYDVLSKIVDDNIVTTCLYPTVLLKTFPTNATFAQIHRIKRERSDRSIVTQAVVVPSTYHSDDFNYGPINPDDIIPTSGAGELIKLLSPEININKNIAKQSGDYIEYITNFNVYHSELYINNFSANRIIKLKGNQLVAFTLDVKSTIKDAIQVIPAVSSTSLITLDSKQYNNFQTDIKGSSGLLVVYDNTSWSAEGTACVVVNYKANVYGSQYGGNTYEDRMSNVSIPCSDVIFSTNINQILDVRYGDTFINYFDVNTCLSDLSNESYPRGYSKAIYVPLESSINCDLRSDTSSMHLSYGETRAALRQEYAGTHTQNDIDKYVQDKDLYIYNTVYSQQIDIKPGISLVVDKPLETVFDCMIKASNVKSNGEITDSWTKFGINEFIEVNSIYGPVNALKFFNNNMYYWQDKAFGALAINDRSLINDKAGAQLVLGTGGVLDRYDYISNYAGCKDKFGLTSSISGIYWYDRISNSIYKFASSLINLTKEKSIQSFITGYVDSTFKVLAHADAQNNEILFTFFKESETNGTTISFNESVDAFISFYGFVPTIYIPYQQRYLTTTNSHYCGSDFNMNNIFLHDSNLWDRCYFYALTNSDANKYVDSTIEMLFNPEYSYTKVFDNLFYQSNTSSKSTMSSPVKSINRDVFADTFSTIQCYNDFQNTGEVGLVTGTFSTSGTNIMRRERGWTLNIPRNIVSSNISTNPDIFTNVNASQTFKERMRDKYLIAYFTYENDGTYDRFSVSNMGIKYRTSYR